MAHDDSGADHVDTDPVRTVDHVMIVEAIFGIFLSVLTPNDTAMDPAGMIYKGIMTGNKIVQKEKNKEMDDSIHEELHIMTKDFIYKLGGIK